MFVSPLAYAFLAACPSPGQQASSPFEAATVQLPKDRPPFRRMADLDLDGDVDALGYRASIEGTRRHFELAAYRNDGTGRFTEVWSYVVAGVVRGADYTLVGEIGFLNGDGLPDVGMSYRGLEFTFIGLGNCQFTYTGYFDIDTNSQALVLADLDGDGRSDWVTSMDWYDNPEHRKVKVRTSTGDLRELNHGIRFAHFLRVLPQDGPGGEDVFVIAGDTRLRIVYRSPGGALALGPAFDHGLTGAMTDVGDVDLDGDVDAVLFQGGEPARYSVLRRTGSDSWELEAPVVGGPAEFLLDVDGDGDLDGACCGGGSETPVFADHVEPTDFQIALNTGGVFAPTFRLAGVGSPQLAGDGDRDLVAGRCVVFVDGAARAGGSHAPDFDPPRSLRDVSDCDGDGDLDVRFALDSVYSNDGSGHFASSTPPVGSPPGTTAYRGPGFPGDFDGDGDVDLLVELVRTGRAPVVADPPPAHGSTLATVLLRNAGQGALLGPVPASSLGVSFALDSRDPELSLLVDADQDGDLDLLTRTLDYAFDRSETRLWANDGTGSFRAGGRLRVYRSLWAGDVDLDGDMDLIASGSGYGGTSTYLLLGSAPVPGRFPTFTWDARPGSWPHDSTTGLAEADLDRDGYPDFGMVTTQAALFENHFAGGGSLAQVELYSFWGLAAAARLDLGDLDGNGLFDVVVGPHAGDFAGIVEVRLGLTGPYTSFSANRQVVPPGLLVDLDGDGDPDLLGERVVLNRTP
jgi:hypothetical protein